MIEVEIKARIKNLKPIEGRLRKLGGKFITRERQIDRIFGRVKDLDGNSMVIEGRFSARVRQKGSKKSVEFKEIRRTGAGMEFSSPLADVKNGLNFLKKLDFEEGFTVDKIRKIYSYKNFEICLDVVKKLGYFIEIEHPVKTGEKKERALEECKNILKFVAPEAIIKNKKYGDLMQELINKKHK